MARLGTGKKTLGGAGSPGQTRDKRAHTGHSGTGSVLRRLVSPSARAVLALFLSECNLSECHLSSYTRVTPVVSRRTSHGLVSTHNDPLRRDGRPRDADGVFAAVEPHTRPMSKLLLHLLTILKFISQCLGL